MKKNEDKGEDKELGLCLQKGISAYDFDCVYCENTNNVNIILGSE